MFTSFFFSSIPNINRSSLSQYIFTLTMVSSSTSNGVKSSGERCRPNNYVVLCALFVGSWPIMSISTFSAKLKRNVSVSPSNKSLEDEIIYLRSQNKLLKNALSAVKDTATEKLSKSYELVWYARNRSELISYICGVRSLSCNASNSYMFVYVVHTTIWSARYPSHEASKWLDKSEEHSKDIDNLRSTDGDFHHGFNSGMLAAARLFKEHADVNHADTSDSVSVEENWYVDGIAVDAILIPSYRPRVLFIGGAIQNYSRSRDETQGNDWGE